MFALGILVAIVEGNLTYLDIFIKLNWINLIKQNSPKIFLNKILLGIPPPPTPPPSGGCSCSTYVSVTTGFGNCEKDFKGKPICYVNEPSSCSDLKENSSTGKRYSWDACRTHGPPLPLGSENCRCSDYVSKSGFGNCKKDLDKNGKSGRICYVIEPSGCPDLTQSQNYPDRKYSWWACDLVGS